MLVKRWLLKAYEKPYSNMKVVFFNMSYAIYEFCIYISIHFYRGGFFFHDQDLPGRHNKINVDSLLKIHT